MKAYGALLLLACAGCGAAPEPSRSRDAKLATHEELLSDLALERHEADGGGRAWLEPPPSSPIAVGSRQRFDIVYEAGPFGVAEGGAIVFQPSPFWGWDPPRTGAPEAPGYTEVSTTAEGIRLDVQVAGGELLVIHVREKALDPGERVRIVYGAGPAGARVDRYAETGSPLWLSVDGDGDGVRRVLEDVPRVDVVAGGASQLLVTLPTTAAPGDDVRVTLAVLDAAGNAGPSGAAAKAVVELPGVPPIEPRELSPRGTASWTARIDEPGVYRARAVVGELTAVSNPLVVRQGVPRVLWGDLHGHSRLSDGSSSPREYFWYAKHVAALDVVSLTDHDHWGMQFLDGRPDLWRSIQRAGEQHHEPGRFVVVPGYEWTSWVHGHRHVLFFEDGGEILSSVDPAYDTPARLWDALAGRDVLTVAHHSAGGPVSTNWDFVPDERMEPVTEVVSVHGSSEAADAPRAIYSGVAGNYVRDVLDRGLRFGFIGSGDGHDGHPGLAHLGAPSGGLAAIFTEELSRPAVLRALRERNVYATNGPRIWLRVSLDDHELSFVVAGTAPLERVDVIRRDQPVLALSADGRTEWFGSLALEPLGPGDYVYVRAVQEDGGAAWSSPFFGGGEGPLLDSRP